jgi:predicted ATP-grasp superfamily ATP-dependent carboligase
VTAWRHISAPESDLGRFVQETADAVRAGGYEIVFPSDDVELLALSIGRADIPAVVPYAGHEQVVRAVDKWELTTAARRCGLSVPRTLEASPAAIEETPLPLLVKARLHWTPGSDGDARHLPVCVCTSRDEARAAVARIQAAGSSALLQELVPGRQLAMSLVVAHNGDLLAAVMQRTLRQSQRHTSVRAETVAIDPRLLDSASRLMRELGWFGLVNLQFLRPDDGDARLIDLNGRFFGSLALSLAAGVNLPALWAEAALGRPAQKFTTGRPGRRFQALEEDLRLTVRDVPLRAAMPGVVGCLRYAVGSTHSTWATKDPAPGLLHGARLAGRLPKKAVTVLRREARRGGPTGAGSARPLVGSGASPRTKERGKAGRRG